MSTKTTKRKRPAPEKGGAFSPAEQLIFRFWNGTKEVGADPVLVYRKLMALPDANLEIDVKLLQTDTPEAAKAEERLVKAVRTVFNVEPWSEDEAGKQRGLTEASCLRLLYDFCDWMAALREETAPFVTSPGTTGGPSSGDPSPTESSAASTSTGPAPSTAAPTP